MFKFQQDIIYQVLIDYKSLDIIYEVLEEFIPDFRKLNFDYTQHPFDENIKFLSEEDMLSCFINNKNLSQTFYWNQIHNNSDRITVGANITSDDKIVFSLTIDGSDVTENKYFKRLKDFLKSDIGLISYNDPLLYKDGNDFYKMYLEEINSKKIIVTDYSVSKEKFELQYDSVLEMYNTFPEPKGENLAAYYETEDYISHTDTKRNLFEKVYHWVRSYALNKKLRLVNSHLKKRTTNISKHANLLDVGCGTGDFLNTCLENGWSVTGIEPNQSAREIANSKTNNQVFDIPKLDQLDKNSYDCITLWHVLEHLPDLNTQINLLKSLLKKDGTLIIAVPNYKSYDAQYYKEFWAAYDVPRHLWHFSQKSIITLFSRIHMKVEKVLPMKFDAYYVSLLSEKYKNGKMNFIKAFFIGLRSNIKARTSKEYSSLIYIIKNR